MFRLERQQVAEIGSAPSVPIAVPVPPLAFERGRDRFAELGRTLRRNEGWILPALWLAVFVLWRPTLAFEDARGDFLVDLAGLGLIAMGQILRAEAWTSLGDAPAGYLAGGTYSLTRNPLYLGALLVNAGLLVIFHHPLAYVLAGALLLLAYGSIVTAEEPLLRRRFGASYAAWCRAVPRWGLKLSTLPAIVSGAPVQWRRVAGRDYAFAASWLLVLLWAGIYEHAVRVNSRPDFPVMLAGAAFSALILSGAWLAHVARHRLTR